MYYQHSRRVRLVVCAKFGYKTFYTMAKCCMGIKGLFCLIKIEEKAMKYFGKDKDEVLALLNSSIDGLTSEESEVRLSKYGENKLFEKKKKSPIVVFLEQFKDLLVIILMIAAIISGATGEWAGMGVIFAVIILNAILGTVQYIKAEKSLSALKKLSAPTAKVVRDGAVVSIPSEQVTIGDIIVLEAGDLVVADGRIVQNYSLQVNESSLTGESTAVEKTDAVIEGEEVALGDQVNMVFSGSLVTYGRAIMVVTAIGMDTEIGKIASLINQTGDKLTPLQKSLNKFSQTLAIIIMAISVLVFGLTLWRSFDKADVLKSVLNSFTFAIALAVAAIPEALGSIVTIVQAVGTNKMAKQNAIIKDLSAVETLGAVSVICSDKTGTLTQNKMTTQEVFISGAFKKGEDIDTSDYGENLLLHSMVLVNDSTNQGAEGIGDPTEIALTVLGQKHGINEVEYRKQYPRLAELAFDSDRKLMSISSSFDGKSYMFTKGALDVILGRVDSILDCGKVRKFTPTDRQMIEDANLKLSQNGLRVLTFAFKPFDKAEITAEDEFGYTFLGLVSMIDPPREESIEAVKCAKIAGIKTVMITGDHKITASAIAKQIGIMDEDDIALNGVELDKMSDEQLNNIIDKVTVYARVSPENKIRIVDAWQRRGNIVAMTGDGVNDSPALKKADIGVAMGITGTEVSKDAASMILTDDNFATIVGSVANGRCVYNNIKNAVMFLLSGNLAGIFCILLTSIMGWAIPFTTIHLLFINLLTDSLPAIAIGMEPASGDLLLQKPRDPKEPLLSRSVLLMIMAQGLLIFAATMGAYSFGKYVGMSDTLATTMSFMTITLARLFHGFNCRGRQSIAKLGIGSNWYVVEALGVGVLLLSFVTFVPGLNGLFDISKDLLKQPAMIGYVVMFAMLPTILIQIYKIISELVHQKNVVSK